MKAQSACLVALLVLLPGCSRIPQHGAVPRQIPPLKHTIQVDGLLEEQCYSEMIPITDFKVASRPGVIGPPTKAWLHWNHAGLWFAFSATDKSIVAAPPGRDEHAVDAQDRVELFLWPPGSSTYFCVEIAPDGAVHDYSAQVYRRFDDSWKPHSSKFVAHRTSVGYSVEGFLSLQSLRSMGLRTWGPGTTFHLGLYRADFNPETPNKPVWLTWMDPGLPEPDFHVRGSFAPVRLER